MSNDKTSFYILASRILHNYFDGLTKLFSDLYLTNLNLLNVLKKSFFAYSYEYIKIFELSFRSFRVR